MIPCACYESLVLREGEDGPDVSGVGVADQHNALTAHRIPYPVNPDQRGVSCWVLKAGGETTNTTESSNRH
jgi:hypothetical protein